MFPFPDNTSPEDIPDYESNKFVEDILEHRPRTLKQKKLREIISYIEEIEGRIPTDIEMQTHIEFSRMISSMNDKIYIEHIRWRGQHILNLSVNGDTLMADRLPFRRP